MATSAAKSTGTFLGVLEELVQFLGTMAVEMVKDNENMEEIELCEEIIDAKMVENEEERELLERRMLPELVRRLLILMRRELEGTSTREGKSPHIKNVGSFGGLYHGRLGPRMNRVDGERALQPVNKWDNN